MRRAYIDIPLPQAQIHCRYSGSTGPWIFLFHQFPLSCRQFERLIPFLGNFSRVYGLDTPGYGVSPAPTASLSIEEYAKTLVAAIDSMGAREFAILGIETGTAIAAEVARQASNERVIATIFIDPPPVEQDRQRDFVADLGNPDLEQKGDHLITEWQRFQNHWGPDVDNAQLRMAVSETFYVYGRFDWGIKAFSNYDLTTVLSEISCPTLLVTVAESIFHKNLDAVSSLIKDVECLITPNRRPALTWTAPQDVAEMIRNLLSRLGKLDPPP